MRDLERLHDVVEYRVNASQIKLLLLGVLAVACAIFAVGVSIGRGMEPSQPAAAPDPLLELERSARASVPDRQETPALTYHDELTAQPERPAAAAPAAPAAPGVPPAPLAAAVAAQPAAPAGPPRPDPPVADEPAVLDEPLPGESSVFTLQVASFETRDEADQLSAELRNRGHRVFLIRTSTPERGEWYRVRVGPFDSRREAVAYQHRFERTERLPTFLVQRRR